MTARRLWPREYGAYAELVFPLITALAAGRPTVPAVAFAVAAGAGFLLHEPLAVLRGTRGERLQLALAGAARARVRALVVFGTMAGAAGWLLAPGPARVAAFVPAACGALLIPPMIAGRVKTMAAELVMAAALSSLLLPVGLSAGVPTRWAVTATVVWFLSFAVATFLVHAVKAWHRPAAPRAVRLAAPLAAGIVVVAAIGVAAARTIPLAANLAVLPTALVALGAAALRVHPRQLRRVGWSVVGANVVSLVLLLAA